MVNAYGCDQFDGFGSHVAAERTSTIHTKAIIEMACVASGSHPFTTTKRNCRAIHHHTKFGSFLGAECVDPVARPLVAPLFFYSFTLVAAYVVLSLFISVITSAMFEVRCMRPRNVTVVVVQTTMMPSSSPRGANKNANSAGLVLAPPASVNICYIRVARRAFESRA